MIVLYYFNSIMVQLKQRLHLQLSQSHHVFQFHKFRFHYGTIKIFAKYFTSEHAICRFQFQYGTIKTYKGHTSRQLDFDFNSIMVQLKPKITLLTPTKIRDFNSIMVQLKLQGRLSKYFLHLISIP